jgi:hypothetical protein
MEQSIDVTQNPSPAASESVIPQTQLPVAPVVTPAPVTPPVGSKTPEENLYAALAEERRLRKEAEDKLKQQETTDPFEPEVISDEAKILKGLIDTQAVKIQQLEDEKALEKILVQYPVLKENLDKFNEFRLAEHPRAKIESVAKIYLAENGLLEGRRVGLENPTGGDRAPVNHGYTAADAENLRKTNWKKYNELNSQGLFDRLEA